MSKFLLAAVLALQLLQVTANEHCDDCESERIAPIVAVNDSSYCQFQLACDQNTPGTGHKYFQNNLEEDVITVERCYSFCFKNVRPHSMSHWRYIYSTSHFCTPPISSWAPVLEVLCNRSPTSLQAIHAATTPGMWVVIFILHVINNSYICSRLSLQAFVCYSACLFSAKDTLRRVFPEVSVADNATCEDYCESQVRN